MILKNYYYNCSPEYIYSIDNGLYDHIVAVIGTLPKRNKQSEINSDLFWLLASYGWNYDTVPVGAGTETPNLFKVDLFIEEIKHRNIRITNAYPISENEAYTLPQFIGKGISK